MTYDMIRWAIERDVPATPKSVLVVLAVRADRSGLCWPSVSCLMVDTALSERAVQSALAFLERAGAIHRETRKRSSTIYRLLPAGACPAVVRRGGAEAEVMGAHAAPIDDREPRRVHQTHPEVHLMHPMGAPDAPRTPTGTITVTASPAEPTAESIPVQEPRQASFCEQRNWRPRLSDRPPVWERLVRPDLGDKIDVDDAGQRRAVIGGMYIDMVAKAVCDAALIVDPNWRGDWDTLCDWLREEFDPVEHIIPAIQQLVRRRGQRYEQPGSLRYFDGALRNYVAAPARRALAHG